MSSAAAADSNCDVGCSLKRCLPFGNGFYSAEEEELLLTNRQAGVWVSVIKGAGASSRVKDRRPLHHRRHVTLRSGLHTVASSPRQRALAALRLNEFIVCFY